MKISTFKVKNHFSSRYLLFLVVAFFIFGYFLRVMYLPQNALTFGYDQARDAYLSQQIVNGHLKIQGPPASTPGLHHGVFYYYVLAPAYWLGHGSPIAAAYWIALLNAGTIFVVFVLAYCLTRNKLSAIFSSLLFAVSFEATQYATWLSNPTIGVWTVPLLYLGLWLWVAEKKRWGALLSGIGLGLSIQAEIFLAYHSIPVLFWLVFARKKIHMQDVGLFFVAVLASLSTMFLAEIKFGFAGLSGIAQLAVSQDAIVASKGLGDFLLLYFNQLGRAFAYSTYPGNIGYGGIFVLTLIILAIISWNKKEISWQPFLAIWLLSHITVVSVGGTSTPFLLVGIGSAVLILVGIFLAKWWRDKKILAVVVFTILLIGNITMIMRENPKGSTIFAIQKDMLLSKQLSAIDYTYQQASGKMFSVNSLTSPLWINIVWTYLYKWYGVSHYGYLPQWHGHDQVGQLDTLPVTQKDTNQYFLILEPMAGIPTQYLPLTIGEDDAVSKLSEEKDFGEIRIQKRMRLEGAHQ